MTTSAVIRCHKCGGFIHDYNRKVKVERLSCPKCGSAQHLAIIIDFGREVVRSYCEPLGKHVGNGSVKSGSPNNVSIMKRTHSVKCAALSFLLFGLQNDWFDGLWV
jgi:DNA-directed RNA polymerase subunit M/transcription elongation factor TFIIS